MSTRTWKLLEKTQERLREDGKISQTFFTSLIRKIQSAMSSESKNDIVEVGNYVNALLKQAYSMSSNDFVKKIPSAESLTDPVEGAFLMGQLNFATQLLSNAADAQVDDETLSIAKEARFRPYLAALAGGPLSGTELADRCDQRVETISRNVGILREQGLIECRREGRVVVNFLTPLGSGIVDSLGYKDNGMRENSAELQQMRNETKPTMRKLISFGTNAKAA